MSSICTHKIEAQSIKIILSCKCKKIECFEILSCHDLKDSRCDEHATEIGVIDEEVAITKNYMLFCYTVSVASEGFGIRKSTEYKSLLILTENANRNQCIFVNVLIKPNQVGYFIFKKCLIL